MMVTLFVALLGGWQAGLRGRYWYEYVAYLLALVGVVSIARVVIMRREHTDWDISERKKRIRPLLLLLGFVLLNVIAVRLWHNTALGNLYIRYTLLFAGFVLLTLKIKLSGHVLATTFASLLVVSWYGLSWWPVLLAIPIIAWARVVGNHHTIREVIIGALYAAAVFGIAFVVFP